jgi:valyl-tRNA synthetase
MSKSLGNSPEPIELIERFGADAVRVGMLLCSPAGNDLLFDEGLIEQGRNFSNKIWNALRLIKGWTTDDTLEQTVNNRFSVEWFESVMNKTLADLEDAFDKYRLSEILMGIYKLVWDDFCSWFLEMIKPGYQQPIDKPTFEAAIGFFDRLVRILHPFMPFITEEIWQSLQIRQEGETIMLSQMPQASGFKQDLIDRFIVAEEVIMTIRTIRKEQNIPFKDQIPLFIRKNNEEQPDLTFDPVVLKLCNLSELAYTTDKIQDSISFVVRTTEFFIPLTHKFDKESELKKLKQELDYARGFLVSVLKKLSNDKFVNNASPAVVEAERKKQSDAEGKIKVLEEQIRQLNN